MGSKLVALNLGWRSAFALLNAAYFFLHYGFAAQVRLLGCFTATVARCGLLSALCCTTASVPRRLVVYVYADCRCCSCLVG